MHRRKGDKVQVRSDLSEETAYYMYGVRHYGAYANSVMIDKFAGCVVTICEIYHYRYHIIEDGGQFVWTDDMFIDLEDFVTVEDDCQDEIDFSDIVALL